MKTKHHSNLPAPVIQSGEQTQNSTMRRKWSALALGGFFFTSIFALSAPSVEAQCQRWDVSGEWLLMLDNKETVQVRLQQGNWQQQSANLTGRGELYVRDPGSYSKRRAGVINSGNITGNSLAIAITVPMVSERQDGYLEDFRFTGTIGPSGIMEGTTKQGVHWVSSRKMKCADATPPISKQKTGDASTNPSAGTDESASTDAEDHHKRIRKRTRKSIVITTTIRTRATIRAAEAN